MVVFAAPDPVYPDSAPSSATAPALPNVLARLRLETRREHGAVEHVLNLMGALTDSTYRERLVQFYGFYSHRKLGPNPLCTARRQPERKSCTACDVMTNPYFHPR